MRGRKNMREGGAELRSGADACTETQIRSAFHGAVTTVRAAAADKAAGQTGIVVGFTDAVVAL